MVKLKKELAPIVVFGYNRPNHLQQTLDALNENKLAESSELYIFLDAPKDKDEVKSCLQVEQICTEFLWKGLAKTITQRPSNWGLAKNITQGVTEILGMYSSIIVLEDDIQTSPDFLTYMNIALDKYKMTEEVMHINSFIPETKFQESLPDTFFTRFMNCWGWATWATSWEFYEPRAEKLWDSLKSRIDHDQFNFNGAIKFDQQLVDNIEGKLNTWAVKWNASIFMEEGLCLSPRRSLSRNIGLDGSGVHYSRKTGLPDRASIDFLSDLPRFTENKIQESYRSRLYLTLHYGLGRNPSRLRIIKFFTKRLLVNGKL